MTNVPARCAHCGHVFPSIMNLVGANSLNFGCSQTCPKCGNLANIANAATDATGKLFISDFFNFFKGVENSDKLTEVKEKLESSSTLTGKELAEVLEDVDPRFRNFSNAIRSIPLSDIATFIQAIVAVISVILLHSQFEFSKQQHDDNYSLQKQQLEFSKEQFEYQKNRDRDDEVEKDQRQKEIDTKIDEISRKYDKQIREVESKKLESKSNARIKGSQRNKPCPCGSGIKAKFCHPSGYFV